LEVLNHRFLVVYAENKGMEEGNRKQQGQKEKARKLAKVAPAQEGPERPIGYLS